jgi:hypothetical protein
MSALDGEDNYRCEWSVDAVGRENGWSQRKPLSHGTCRANAMRAKLGLSVRAEAQEIIRRLPTPAGPGHVEFVVDKVTLGQVLSEYFGFP